MSRMQGFNEGVISEFRRNGGRVGGSFAGADLLLLTTTGARSGLARTTPLVYRREGERVFVFASKAGAPTNPDWYGNLLKNPEVTVEIGDGAGGVKEYRARAVPLEGAERERVFEAHAGRYPAFDEYRRKTERSIPVVELHPAGNLPGPS